MTASAHSRLGRSVRLGEPAAARGRGRPPTSASSGWAAPGWRRSARRSRPARASSGSTPARSPAARRAATAASCSPARRASTTMRSPRGGASAPPGSTRSRSPSSTGCSRRSARSRAASARCGSPPRRRRRARSRRSSPRCERDGFPARPPTAPAGAGCSSPPTDRSSRSSAAGCSPGGRWRRARGCSRDSPATAIAGDRVETPGGAVRCRAVVVCVDGWMERVLPELEGRVRSSRLQMLATEPVAPGTVPCPVYDNWGYEYWQQTADDRIALGGGRRQLADGEWGQEAVARRPGAGPARRAAARARRHRRAGDPSLGRRDRLHRRPAAGARGAAAGGDRGRCVLRPRQRPGLRGGPRGDGDRTRWCAVRGSPSCCVRSIWA